MMPDNDDFSDASQFYNTEGRKILTASLIAFYFAGYDFIDTCKMVFQSSWKDLFSRIDETKNQDAINISIHLKEPQNRTHRVVNKRVMQ